MALQSLYDTLDYCEAVLTSDTGRFRGGVVDGMNQLQQAAQRDGLPWQLISTSESLMIELRSLIESLQDPTASRPPREKSVRWYQQKQHEPIAPGVEVTVLQACYWALYTRHFRGLNERGMDDMCGVLSAGGFLPENNLMPRCDTLLGCFHVPFVTLLPGPPPHTSIATLWRPVVGRNI